MKKYLAVLIAALFVVGMSAFTIHHSGNKHYDSVYFHFKPANGGEGAYETTGSWEVASSNQECSEPSGDPCIIMVDESILADLTDDDSKVQSLVDFLEEQNGQGLEYADAVTAVNDFTISYKP